MVPDVKVQLFLISLPHFTCVCVQVVPQQRDCSEGSATQVTFVRPLVSVALHVSIQIRTSWAGVATELTLESFLHT